MSEAGTWEPGIAVVYFPTEVVSSLLSEGNWKNFDICRVSEISNAFTNSRISEIMDKQKKAATSVRLICETMN